MLASHGQMSAAALDVLLLLIIREIPLFRHATPSPPRGVGSYRIRLRPPMVGNAVKARVRNHRPVLPCEKGLAESAARRLRPRLACSRRIQAIAPIDGSAAAPAGDNGMPVSSIEFGVPIADAAVMTGVQVSDTGVASRRRGHPGGPSTTRNHRLVPGARFSADRESAWPWTGRPQRSRRPPHFSWPSE